MIPCPSFSLSQLDQSSVQDELFLLPSCLPNETKLGLFGAWAAIFALQFLFFMVVTLREFFLYGFSQAAVALVLITASSSVFFLTEIGFLFHISSVWNVIFVGLSLWMVLLVTTLLMNAWFRATVAIRLIKKAAVLDPFMRLSKIALVIFVAVVGGVLAALWIAAIVVSQVSQDVKVFNSLIAVGFGWLAINSLGVSVFLVFVCRRVVNILVIQSRENPDQEVYRPEIVKNRVIFYSYPQAFLFFSNFVLGLALLIWMFATSFTDESSAFTYFFHLGFSLISFLQLTLISLIILHQERHITFQSTDLPDKKTSQAGSNNSRRSSESSRKLYPEDSPVVGLGGTIAFHSRHYLPTIEELENNVDGVLENFIKSIVPDKTSSDEVFGMTPETPPPKIRPTESSKQSTTSPSSNPSSDPSSDLSSTH